MYTIRCRKNALLIQTGVEIVWENKLNGSWDAYLTSPADFAGVDDIVTNLAKEREPGIEIIKRTPQSVIISSNIVHGKTSLFPNLMSYQNTVNSLNCGHPRDHDLVSLIARIRNSENLFQSNICNSFLLGI